jgi:glycosyltransferase involved in cell wall biosynthesis
MIAFEVIMRARNAEDYIVKAIKSLLWQDYQHWHCTIALDCSTDNTLERILAFLVPFGKFTLKWQFNHVGLVKNMVDAIEFAQPQKTTVLAVLDGDDWLRRDALSIVAKKYSKHPDTLLTYGSYIKESKGARTKTSRPYPPDAIVRNYRWQASHLKTFKSALWDKLPIEHLKHNGSWLPAASDVAIMLPMMEIAGLDRCRHVHQTIYHYRDHTPQTCNRNLQRKCEAIIRAKPPLKRDKSL